MSHPVICCEEFINLRRAAGFWMLHLPECGFDLLAGSLNASNLGQESLVEGSSTRR